MPSAIYLVYHPFLSALKALRGSFYGIMMLNIGLYFLGRMTWESKHYSRVSTSTNYLKTTHRDRVNDVTNTRPIAACLSRFYCQEIRVIVDKRTTKANIMKCFE